MYCWWESRLVQPLWKAVWRYLKKLKMYLPFNPVIPLMGIYPKEHKTLIQKNISTLMLSAALYTIANIWKQPTCPSVDEWLKQLRYIYTMEFYTAERKKEFLPFVTAWMKLESIILSEISQAVKDKYHMISTSYFITSPNLT